MSKTPARTTRRHLLAAAALTLTAGLPTTADTEADAPMKHIVLLGDSVFDNAVYVAGGPDVIEQVRERLPAGWRATLRAVDGSVIGSVERQLHLLPPKPSHLVISVGGNDALRHAGVLDETTRSMADALDRLAGIRDQFAQEYAAMLNGVLGRGLPTAICTIYEPRFPDLRQRRLAATGLMVFNDCITREAFARGLSLIDLRLICDRDEDFANPIEPSFAAGQRSRRPSPLWSRTKAACSLLRFSPGSKTCPSPRPGGRTMPTQPMQDGADRRTQLAADRTVLAAERTYAAWVRIGLAALASGVGAKKLLEGVIPSGGSGRSAPSWCCSAPSALARHLAPGVSPDRRRPSPIRRGSRRRSKSWSTAS